MGVNAVELLLSRNACKPAMDWVRGQKDKRPQALWDACPRPEWLVWWMRLAVGSFGAGMDQLTRILVEHEIAYPTFGLDREFMRKVWLRAVDVEAPWSSWGVLEWFGGRSRPKRSRLLLARIRREFPEPPGVSS